MTGKFRIVEHPADLGIEAEGETVGDAFATAAEALTSLIVDCARARELGSRIVEITASDYEQLLVRWLSEVLWLFDGEHFVTKTFTIVNISPTSLRATLTGEMFVPERHPARMDVKAVTYHQISVTRGDGGTLVRVYLDI